MDVMENPGGNPGINMLANVLSGRMKKESESPLVLDFGEIQANGSLLTNTFPVPVPKGDYTVCRHLTLGEEGTRLADTARPGTTGDGGHSHDGGSHGGHEAGDGSHSHDGGQHIHEVLVPAKMRGLQPGDRVLVAWVQSEAVVVDIIERS